MAGGLSIYNHVKGQLYPPVLRIGSRVTDSGELLPRRQITAAPGIIDDPVLYAVVKNKTEEAVQLSGFLERISSQVFIPGREEGRQKS